MGDAGTQRPLEPRNPGHLAAAMRPPTGQGLGQGRHLVIAAVGCPQRPASRVQQVQVQRRRMRTQVARYRHRACVGRKAYDLLPNHMLAVILLPG